jgi:hypothetical protein
MDRRGTEKPPWWDANSLAAPRSPREEVREMQLAKRGDARASPSPLL